MASLDNMQFAPLRPLADFLMESARFQIPNFKDPEKWSNRVLNNLLYYQTNYFIVALVVFVLIGVIHPIKMVVGFAAITAAFVGFVYSTKRHGLAQQLKRDHPIVSTLLIVATGYILVYLFGAVIVFLFGIALPLLLILLHASLRLRNIKNKVVNMKLEFVGVKRTPMGFILEGLGQEQEAGS